MNHKKILAQLKTFPVFFMLFSALGLAGSFILAVEHEHLLKNPDATLNCTINPVYSCQSVITSDQASILGFSNEYIGIALFGGLLAIGFTMLAGAQFKPWLYKLVWLALIGAMGMVFWFFYQSVYTINALCIYCSSVWFASWSLFVGYTRWLLKEKIIKTPKPYTKHAELFIQNAPLIWFLLVALFAGLILNHFWYYYGQYF